MDPVIRVRDYLLDNVGHLAYPGSASFTSSEQGWLVPIYCRTEHGAVMVGDVQVAPDGNITFAPSREEMLSRLGTDLGILISEDGSKLKWYELCENPRGMTSYYSSPPLLDDVLLREVGLTSGAPSIEFWFELPFPPDKVWWDAQATIPTLLLSLWPVQELRFQGFGKENRGSFQLKQRMPKGLQFSFESEVVVCSGICDKAMIQDLRANKIIAKP